MAFKAWEFLLPDSGKHQVLVELIGEPGQRVFIDGQLQTSSSVCEGPDNSLLELRRCRGTGQWQLLVNGLTVEDYDASARRQNDDSLRGLKSMPEGSYMIAPQLQATGLDAVRGTTVVEEYVFKACGQRHGVQVVLTAEDHLMQFGQPRAVWEIIFDGTVVERYSGDERGTNAVVPFCVSLDGIGSVEASLKIMWFRWPVPARYRYRLTFGGVDVPCYTGVRSPAGRMPTGVYNIPVVMASESSTAAAVFVVGHEAEYLVDNRRLLSHTLGLCYRLSKNEHHKNEGHVEPWGSIVRGVADSDGWVLVGGEYLPVLLDGLPVLTLLSAADVHHDSEESTEAPSDDLVAGSLRHVEIESLPQGVSLNRQTGRYQAAIKARTGRWVDLGEYDTADEAHQKYLEAIPVQNPDKVLAPSVNPFGAS